jgi:hypothetical protein
MMTWPTDEAGSEGVPPGIWIDSHGKLLSIVWQMLSKSSSMQLVAGYHDGREPCTLLMTAPRRGRTGIMLIGGAGEGGGGNGGGEGGGEGGGGEGGGDGGGGEGGGGGKCVCGGCVCPTNSLLRFSSGTCL